MTAATRLLSEAAPFLVCACLALGPLAGSGAPAGDGGDKDKVVRVLIETEKGDIEVELDGARAQVTVANFLRYVDGKFYDGGRFHRTVTKDNQPDDKVKIEVVQAGINPDKMKDEFPPIKLERTRDTRLAHKDGTISMARDGPDTATSDFFVCVGDQPELDFGGKRNPDGQGFAAFGKVVKGMDVVKKIQAGKADGQALAPPVKIVTVRRKP
jgi:peptidyl-prolyl cis-trans isomerase A (cyclophilin A)